ncbi:MAG: DUF3987 domain-containing protein [Phycisphaeraceae bacterium]
MTPIDLVLSKIDAKPAGPGKWQARCPGHDDRKPSLSIATGDDGRALLHCQAGCTVEAVTAALGLTMRDLMPADTTRRSKPKTRVVSTSTPRTFPTAREAVGELDRRHGKHAATWTYHNAGNEPVGVVVRWNLPDGTKDIRPVAKNCTGWVIAGMPEPRPLYRLPDLAAADDVWVCEGEKTAEAGRALGIIATTSPHGAKSADKADWRPMAGKRVVILPDHDEAGERYADDVAGILVKLTPAPVVRIVRLAERWPELPEGGDLADVLAIAGGDGDAVRAELEKMVAQAEPVQPTTPAPVVDLFVPFPVEALPEPVRGFVVNATKSIGCDSSFVALPILIVCAAAIGNTRRLRIKPGWDEPPILWGGPVGDSGTMKTPAFRLAMKPLREVQAEAFKAHEEKALAYQTEKAHYEVALTAWKRKPEGDPPAEPVEPTPARCIVSDTTVEALAPILEANPRGVLLGRDELSGWLGSFDRYAGGKGGADAAHWLSMFNGESLTVDRKTGPRKTIHVDSAAVWVCGGIQPEILRRALGREHRENGMAARLLLAMPPRKVKRWTEGGIDPAIEARIALLVERLRELRPEQFGDKSEPVAVAMTPQAKTAWIAYYNAHAREQAELSGDLSAAWSKLEAYAGRLALVVHFVRWAAGDTTLADPDHVDEMSIAAGVALSRWFGGEARRIYSMLGESDEERDGRRLVELVERKGGTITPRELQRASRAYATAEAAELALADLVGAGAGRWEPQGPGPKGGRAVRVFTLHAPTVDTTPQNTLENIGCVSVSSVSSAQDAGGGWGEEGTI